LEADADIEIGFFSVSVDIDTATLRYASCCRDRGILKIHDSSAQLKFTMENSKG
jgi:hypothetical protein